MSFLKQNVIASSLLIAMLSFTACQKDIHRGVENSETGKLYPEKTGNSKMAQRALKASFTTWYRFHPINQPQPVQIGQNEYLGILNVPGGGEGQATHIGMAKTYFNQTAYVKPPDFATVVGSVAAPASAIPSYPVTGGSLPLIQQGDFVGITNLFSGLHLPSSIDGHIISTIIYDSKSRDAFFISVKSGDPIVINGTTATTKGKSLIVGGRGKFEGAKGEANHVITFDIANANKASYSLDGWVMY